MVKESIFGFIFKFLYNTEKSLQVADIYHCS